jgi:hypothetical protein
VVCRQIFSASKTQYPNSCVALLLLLPLLLLLSLLLLLLLCLLSLELMVASSLELLGISLELEKGQYSLNIPPLGQS